MLGRAELSSAQPKTLSDHGINAEASAEADMPAVTIKMEHGTFIASRKRVRLSNQRGREVNRARCMQLDTTKTAPAS